MMVSSKFLSIPMPKLENKWAESSGSSIKCIKLLSNKSQSKVPYTARQNTLPLPVKVGGRNLDQRIQHYTTTAMRLPHDPWGNVPSDHHRSSGGA